MAIIDDIVSILRGANPDADPQAVQAQAEQLASSPNAASVMQNIFGAATGMAAPVSSMLGHAAVGAGDVVNSALPSLPSAPTMPSAAPVTPPTAPSPTPATPAPSPASPVVPSPSPAAPAPSGTPPAAPMTPPASSPATSSDQATRQAQLAAANKKANLTEAIGGSIAGIGDTLAGGLRAFGDNPGPKAQDQVIANAKNQLVTDKSNIEQGISNDPNSEASKAARALVLQIAPQMANQPGFNTMTDQELRDKLPLVDTMMKAKASEDAKKVGLAQAQSNRELSLGLRQDQQQDKLEQNAKQMVANLRGDRSLARTEEQRDAAIVAYNRLDQIQKSGQPMNPVDYADVLGQIYKARTGAAPGEQIMNDIHQSTAEGNLGKAYTYVTGQQAPATSQAITSSLKNMAQSMGQQADKLHTGYMNSHLIKPSGLEDSRWAPIASAGRGTSFADATQATAPAASPKSDPLGIR